MSLQSIDLIAVLLVKLGSILLLSHKVVVLGYILARIWYGTSETTGREVVNSSKHLLRWYLFATKNSLLDFLSAKNHFMWLTKEGLPRDKLNFFVPFAPIWLINRDSTREFHTKTRPLSRS